jgi:hypothetical protein
MATKKKRKLPTTGPCRLCDKHSILLESHVLPEFLYKPTYDENHRAIVVRLDEMDKGHARKGLRENLLCDACEKFLSQEYEDYFAREWTRRPRVITEPSVVVAGLDYRRVMLFFLSILWRASISTRKEFVDSTLGTAEDSVKQLLLGSGHAALSRFRLYVQALVYPSGHVADGIIKFPQRRTDENSVDHFLIAAGGWWMVTRLGDNDDPSSLPEGCLRETGELTLYRLPIAECPLLGGAAPLFRQIEQMAKSAR